jgi:hypothetical protein
MASSYVGELALMKNNPCRKKRRRKMSPAPRVAPGFIGAFFIAAKPVEYVRPTRSF